MHTFESTSRWAQTPAGKIHYHQAGEGPTVVLLHGSGPGATGWSNFSQNINSLAQRYRVVVPDMPGWGMSDAVTFEGRDHVSALLGLLDALHVERAALVGNSMGGATSLGVAAHHPERVSHLVTMGAPAPGAKMFAAGGGPTEGLKALFTAYREPSYENFRQLVDVMTFDEAFAEESLVRQRMTDATERPDHLRNFVDGLTTEAPAKQYVTEGDALGIDAPTLVLHGRDDRVVSYENGLRLTALIAKSRLVLINRCGHWLQLEHAHVFSRMVEDFITHE